MTRHQFVIWAAVILASFAIFLASTARGRASDPRAGQAFAVENCSRCHAVGGTGASPNKKAPSLRSIARKYKLEDLEEGFAEGMVTGHNAMPEFTLTPREIDNLLAHMRRLKR
ncbi:MAG: c-type cytochrome [Beijerinckiaceae bacterium]